MAIHKPVRQSAEQIKKLAAELAESAASLDAMADSMVGAGFDSLDVTGFDQMMKAIRFTDSYCGAVRSAIRNAKTARGDFSVQSSVAATTKKPAKK